MRRVLIPLAFAIALTGLLSGSAGAVESARVDAERLPVLEQGVLTKLNALRASKGLRPLAVANGLQGAALAHSQSMLGSGYFEHESKDGSPFFVRVKRYYPAAGFSEWSAGENLLYASGEVTPARAIKAWLNSPAHRENMLSPTWREVGIGAVHANAAGGAFGGKPTVVITVDFGTRTGPTPQTAGVTKPGSTGAAG